MYACSLGSDIRFALSLWSNSLTPVSIGWRLRLRSSLWAILCHLLQTTLLPINNNGCSIRIRYVSGYNHTVDASAMGGGGRTLNNAPLVLCEHVFVRLSVLSMVILFCFCFFPSLMISDTHKPFTVFCIWTSIFFLFCETSAGQVYEKLSEQELEALWRESVRKDKAS